MGSFKEICFFFLENFQSDELEKVKEKLENICHLNAFEKISDVILDLNNVFEDTRLKSFPVKQFKFNKKKRWYDLDLDRAKKRYSAIRKGKNAHLKAAHGKFYKKLLVSKSKAHNEKVSNELRTLNTSNPQKYWATLKKGNQINH